MKKRETVLSVDLLAWKEPWLRYCREAGLNSSEEIRKLIASELDSNSGAPKNVFNVEGSSEKVVKKITLKRSELKLISELCARDGFTISRWIVALIRSKLFGGVQLGSKELEQLGRSNFRLLAIGRNLNQVARVLNSSPEHRDKFKVEDIERLATEIKNHVKQISQLMASNLEKWE